MTRRLTIETLQIRRLMASDLAAETIVRLNEIRFFPDRFADHSDPAQADWWRSESPRQPLAFNSDLSASASDHATAMASGSFLDYRNPRDGSTPNQRARAAGYALPASVATIGNDIELIAAGQSLRSSESLIDEVLRVQLGDSSRRDFLMTAAANLTDADEIGIGESFDASTTLGQYWVIDIARRETGNLFITGVIYDDANGNARFDAGEGIGNATIRSGTLHTTSDASGLYSLPIAGGNHRVIATLPDDFAGDAVSPSLVQDVRIEAQNVQVNFEVSGKPTVNFRPRSLWTSHTSHLDVNADGFIQALDALNIINYLNANTSSKLPESPQSGDYFLDTSGDGHVTALDALLVINWLNESGSRVSPLAFEPLDVMHHHPTTAERNHRVVDLHPEARLF